MIDDEQWKDFWQKKQEWENAKKYVSVPKIPASSSNSNTAAKNTSNVWISDKMMNA